MSWPVPGLLSLQLGKPYGAPPAGLGTHPACPVSGIAAPAHGGSSGDDVCVLALGGFLLFGNTGAGGPHAPVSYIRSVLPSPCPSHSSWEGNFAGAIQIPAPFKSPDFEHHFGSLPHCHLWREIIHPLRSIHWDSMTVMPAASDCLSLGNMVTSGYRGP